jgi:hypothetical protein
VETATSAITNNRPYRQFGNIAEVIHPAEGSFDLSGYENVVDAVISIITRHPMRQDELERTLARWSAGQVSKALSELEASGRAQIVERNGISFWSATPSYYPNKNQSQRTIPDHERWLFSTSRKRSNDFSRSAKKRIHLPWRAVSGQNGS